MKKSALLLAAALAIASCGKPQTVAIISVNDMHGHLTNMSKLAAVADSIRAIYPKTLILSAGDNRTGYPVSDMYKEPSWPMTDLMNHIGFDGSTLGNHEFDATTDSFVLQASKSNFPYICANITVNGHDESIIDHKIFDFDGQGPRIAVFGVTQIDPLKGIPDMNPDIAANATFLPERTVIPRYKRLARGSDAIIMLSHCGYEEDVELAENEADFVDLIVGGHSHTLIEGGESHNGVWITQCERKLLYATITKMEFRGKRLAGISSEIIDLKHYQTTKPEIDSILAYYNNDATLQRAVGSFGEALPNKEEVGILMCESIRSELGVDIVLQNAGSVRTYEFPAGKITVNDLLTLDPFGNEAIVYSLKGSEVKEIIKRCYIGDLEYGPGYASGACYKIVTNRANPLEINNIYVTTEDGLPINDEALYTMAISSYVAAITDADEFSEGANSGYTTVSLLESYIKKHSPIVGFAGKSNMTWIVE